MNVIARLEYELAYYDSAVHRFNHYTTRTPPHISICGDNKIGVNHNICSDSYPIPNIGVAIHALACMSVFTKIDLKIPIDDNFKEVTAINTPIGVLKWRRMPYGIKTANSIFKRAIEQVLGKDIKDIVCYQDDICIGATNKNELKKKTNIVFNR